MGLIVNKPAPDLRFADLLKQLEIPMGPEAAQAPVHFGGPVQHGRGFVLHSRDYSAPGASLAVNDAFAMTATLDVLQDMARGAGPERAMASPGFSAPRGRWCVRVDRSHVQKFGMTTLSERVQQH